MPYFIAHWQDTLTKAQVKIAQKRIKAVDQSIDLVANLNIPGCTTRMWLERPNDGTNDYRDRHISNRQAKEIVEEMLNDSAT